MAVTDNQNDVVTYKPPRGLQTILSFGFFFILLFMVNAIAGAIWLATHNLQTDALVFALMFATGAVLLFYAGIFLFAASHSEIHIGPDQAAFVLPNWRGPTPLFPYTECQVPYRDLASVETRSEVYRYFALPVTVRSACLVRKDGQRLTLGYVQDDPQDPWIPFHTIAEQIAERAGVPIVNRGTVDGSSGLRALVQDEPSWDTPEISAERVAKIRKMERIGWTALVMLLALVIVAAVGFQIYRLAGG
jgi:hypothetical protein